MSIARAVNQERVKDALTLFTLSVIQAVLKTGYYAPEHRGKGRGGRQQTRSRRPLQVQAAISLWLIGSHSKEFHDVMEQSLIDAITPEPPGLLGIGRDGDAREAGRSKDRGVQRSVNTGVRKTCAGA